MKHFLTVFLVFGFSEFGYSKTIQTNAAQLINGPEWLTRIKAEKVINRIQRELEWTVRKIDVHFYSSESEFVKAHSLGPIPRAVSVKSPKSQAIHFSPRVTESNFSQVFAHELVHIIFYQKYRGSIPSWLEEGFANHLGKMKSVNYKWMAKQPFPESIETLSHPFKGSPVSIKYHYQASQALVEMLDKKCDLENLLRLSVQRKMKDYIKTYCEIPNIDEAFKKWVTEKAGA